MASMRQNPRLQVGSTSWIIEERANAMQIAETEAEEFTFSVRNEVDWLNEHMAEIFTKNQVNVAEIFKTPGKLRGKTPRTAKRTNPLEARVPLSDVFSATPQGAPSPFRQAQYERPPPAFKVAEDAPAPAKTEPLAESRPSSANAYSSEDPFQRKAGGMNNLDSGYYGSQFEEATQPNTQLNTQPIEPVIYESTTPQEATPELENSESEDVEMSDGDKENEEVPIEAPAGKNRESEGPPTTEGSFQSAREDQTRTIAQDMAPQAEEPAEIAEEEDQVMKDVNYPVLESPLQHRSPERQSPQKRSPQKSPAKLPLKSPAKSQSPLELRPEEEDLQAAHDEDEQMEDAPEDAQDAPYPSDGSSPLRPIVRKSSLNFASLPAREPLTTKKSIGNRTSRTSHLDQTRSSYYGRHTGGKSLGNVKQDAVEQDDEDMDVDELEGPDSREESDADTKMTQIHNKTSTQRLQDQISMLGQSQPNPRPASKSLVGAVIAPSQASQPTQPPTPQQARAQRSPKHQAREFVVSGAFPDDEDDSWIGPPTTNVPGASSVFSPRPTVLKSYSTDVMENIHGKDSIGGSQFNMPKRGDENKQRSPFREVDSPERPATAMGHTKSASASAIMSPQKDAERPASPKKTISVSNPNPSSDSVKEDSSTPPRSPTRALRGSPLKAAKDKFSSILKTSRGLFASSAAVSAEAKTTFSPPSAKIAIHATPSFEDVLMTESNDNKDFNSASGSSHEASWRPQSPSKAGVRKTRASTEKEEKRKEEAAREAREAKEAKEAQKMSDQLDKARMKVQEEARVFHQEQERAATLQKEALARKEQERVAKSSQIDLPKATRSSPRKTKAQLEAEGVAAAAAEATISEEAPKKDVEMAEAPSMLPPTRPKSQIGRPAAKRPLRPAKEAVSKVKPPTVIRVDTGSQRGHQYHPSTSTLAATLEESLAAPSASASSQPSTLRHKASSSSIQSKASTNSYNAKASKALEAAARKREQDEAAAQRKKEQKLEIERQRAAAREEERRQQELQRKRDQEKQLEIKREKEQAAAAIEAKRQASRQAVDRKRLELAKQTRAPPPAIRPQHNQDWHDKALPPVPAQRSELGGKANASRLNAALNAAKAPPKRPLQPEINDEHNSRPALQRSGPSYQNNESKNKRVRTNEYSSDDELSESHPKMTAPPIRQSGVRQKDAPTKSLFPSGYAHAPPPANLQKSTLMSQHQSKASHPMDMAQVSKGHIPFASSSGHASGQTYKTPARPGTATNGTKSAKSVARPSPKYENGENIDLPEIMTDSDEEDEDEEHEKKKDEFAALGWTDSPEIRKQLALQETIDPSEVFGRPGPLNMEEVFSKSKDRFHKFRARTSSANWSGTDKLTDDEVRKDLEARDRVRRQGGWTYDSMV